MVQVKPYPFGSPTSLPTVHPVAVADVVDPSVDALVLDAPSVDPPARRRGPQGAAAPGVPRGRLLSRRGKPSFIAGCPIVGFTGPNGAGKTLVAASCVINDDLRAGRPVYSTVAITSPWGDSLPIRSLRELLEVRDATVFIDEVAVLFSSRDSMTIPKEFDVFLQTMRHHGVTLRWTAPAWARADLRVREVTQVVVNVFNLGRRQVPGSFWPRPLFIMAGALDATGVATDSKPDRVLKRRVFAPELLVGWGAYDTLADTPRIGHTHSGSCVDCGGTIKREPCSVDRHRDLGLPTSTAVAPPPAVRQRR